MSLPIAIQLYSLRDEAEQDFFGTLKKVKEMGYDGVEFAGLYGKEPEAVKAFCEEIGLVPISAHVPLDPSLIEDREKVIADYKALGCEYIAIPYIGGDRRPSTGRFYETINDIREVGMACKEQRIQLLYHNHDFEFEKIDGFYALDLIYSKIEPEYLMTEIDTCWVNVAGEDPAKYVEQYTNRSPVVHLKDFTLKDTGGKLYELIGIEEDDEEEEEALTFKPIGHGQQDMPAILAACKKANSKWVVVEQDRPDTKSTPLEDAKKSIDYLKSITW